MSPGRTGSKSKWKKGRNEFLKKRDDGGRKRRGRKQKKGMEKLHTGRRWKGPESRGKVPKGGSPEYEEAEQLPTAPPNDGRPLPLPPPSSRAINPHSQRGGKSAGTQLGAGQAAGCRPGGRRRLGRGGGGLLPASIGPFSSDRLETKTLPVLVTSEGKDGSRGVRERRDQKGGDKRGEISIVVVNRLC